MWKIEANTTISFEDVVGICPASGWRADIESRAEPLLFWVVLKDGRTFGVVKGLAIPQVADLVMNFHGYVSPDEHTTG
jgi:hypothetical protein